MLDPHVEKSNVMYNLWHQQFDDNREETVPPRWLIIQDTEVYQQGLKKLVPRQDECFSFGGECAGQWGNKIINKSGPFLLELRNKELKK